MGKFIDLTGKRFGKLVVLNLEYTKKDKNDKNVFYWRCICDCGNEKVLLRSSLTNNLTKSCGCLCSEITISKNKNKLINLENKKYGMLTVLELESLDPRYGALWRCMCDCGNETISRATNLKSGQTTSCGCLSESSFATEIKKFFIYCATSSKLCVFIFWLQKFCLSVALFFQVTNTRKSSMMWDTILSLGLYFHHRLFHFSKVIFLYIKYTWTRWQYTLFYTNCKRK